VADAEAAIEALAVNYNTARTRSALADQTPRHSVMTTVGAILSQKEPSGKPSTIQAVDLPSPISHESYSTCVTASWVAARAMLAGTASVQTQRQRSPRRACGPAATEEAVFVGIRQSEVSDSEFLLDCAACDDHRRCLFQGAAPSQLHGHSTTRLSGGTSKQI
jgi:hypothetical protein